MANLLYNEKNIIGKLFIYFKIYFSGFSAPTTENLFLLVLANSIRSLYTRFLAGVTTKSLNAFYYICSYSKMDYALFMNITARIALKLIPQDLKNEPVFLCIDDTMIAKFGKRFEDVSKLFDHAAHNGSNYLHGHCFVSLMLCVPVWRNRKIGYLSIPLGYRMWTSEVSKLELATSMIGQIMDELKDWNQVILLFDSWYAKKTMISILNEYSNLHIICNARCDSVLYDLPPAPSGRKGRPAKHGKRLSILTDFELSVEKIGDYFLSSRKVLTNIFGDRIVHAYVTASVKTTESRRLFFSTISPEQIRMACAWQEKAPLNQTCRDWMQYVPLFLYSFRWNIEVSYYEQKTFWSLCSYMVRSRKSIEMLVNLINISYCAMKIMPYQDSTFKGFRNSSVQEFRFALSEQIKQQVFFATFVKNVETSIKSNTFIQSLKSVLLNQGYHY